MAKERINNVRIIGTVTEATAEVKVSANSNAKYTKGKLVVKCDIPLRSGDNEVTGYKTVVVEPNFMCMEKTKDGNINKNFETLSTIEKFRGKRVNILAELEEGMIAEQDSVRTYNNVRVKFISLAKEGEEDCATFQYSGFVTRELYEKNDKEGNLVSYQFAVGQESYDGKQLTNIVFDVEPTDIDIVNGVQSNYTKKSTIIFDGMLDFVTTTETEMAQVAFGTATPKTVVRTIKKYRVTGGNAPLVSGSTVYTDEDIEKLLAAHKVKEQNEIARVKARSGATQPAAPQMTKARSSLL